MSQPYSAQADVMNQTLTTLLSQAAWNVTSNLPSSPSDVDLRIQEGDAEIDSRLGAMGYALPFTNNPLLLKSLSVLYARYACFRDLFAGGSPSSGTDAIKHFKDEFDTKMKQLEDGWASLLTAAGAVVVPTTGRFGVGVARNTASVDNAPGELISSYMDDVDSNDGLLPSVADNDRDD